MNATNRGTARIVGATYILIILLGPIPEFYVPSQLYRSTPLETQQSIAAHLPLFRLGTASNLVVFTLSILQVCGSYLILAPVRRGIAIGATVVRLIEVTLLLGIVINDVNLARLLADPASSALAATFAIERHADIYSAALFLSGIGSALFAWLWLRSRIVPRAIAGIGLLGFTILTVREFLLVAAPNAGHSIGILMYGLPIFAFDVGIGVWLLAARVTTE